MNTKTNDQPPTEDMLGVVSMFLVGGGVISFALFPFLLPGIAILAVLAVPLLPLLIPVVLLWALAAVGLFVVRRVRRRADRRALRTQARLSP